MLINELEQRKLIQPPRWMATNTAYLTIMGSVAYGVSNDTSDMDIYGFCVPPKADLFPHLKGEIPGFGVQSQRFETWQQHHITDASAMGGSGRVYDFQISSIVKYVQLCMENNPNMIDSLFTPQNCVLHATPIANLIRDNRNKFLHKGCWPKFKGYAYSQLHKMEEPARASLKKFEASLGITSSNHLVSRLSELEDYIRDPANQKFNWVPEGAKPFHQVLQETLSSGDTTRPTHLDVYRTLLKKGGQTPVGKRKILVETYGYDVKYAYHLVRLLLEVEQILTTGTIDLQRDKEMLKSIRNGSWIQDEIRKWAADKEADLEKIYASSQLPWGPDQATIKKILQECLEMHYGSLEGFLVQPDKTTQVLRGIQELLDSVKDQLK